MEQRTSRVDGAGAVAREQLEGDERRAPARRAFVLQAPPEQLELLPEAELADRAVCNGAFAVVGAARQTLDLVLPAGAKGGQLALGALLGERGRLRRSCRELRQRSASVRSDRRTAPRGG
jgi:hypothetical protein